MKENFTNIDNQWIRSLQTFPFNEPAITPYAIPEFSRLAIWCY